MLVSFNKTKNHFTVDGNTLGVEAKKQLMFIEGSVLNLAENTWEIPARKQALEALEEAGFRLDEVAKEAAEGVRNQAAFLLSYDEKTKVFELYVGQGQGRPIAEAIGGCRYRRNRGCYSIPDNLWSLQRLYEILPKSQIDVDEKGRERLDQYTQKVRSLERVVQKVRTIKPVERERVPTDDLVLEGKHQPYEHQVKMWWSAHHILEHNETGFFFFCGVGTGKSMVAINVALSLEAKGLVRRVLVITPASLKFNFAEQIQVHSKRTVSVLHDYAPVKGGRRWRFTKPGVAVERYYDGFNEYVEDPDAFFVVVNYEAVVADPGRFQKGFDLAIVDEVHYLKTRSSKRTRATKSVLDAIPRRLGMTGTPVAKNPLDLWSLYNSIDADIFPNRFADFEDALVVKKMTEGGFPVIVDWKDEGLDWVNDRIYDRAIHYQTQECIDLPESTYSEISLSMPAELKSMYDSMKEHLVIEIGEMGEDGYRFIESPNALAALSRLRQLAAGFVGSKTEGRTTFERIDPFKVEATMELIEGVVGEEQVLVWYHHTFFKDWLVEYLKKAKIPFDVIQGGMGGQAIAATVNNFQAGFSRVLLANLAISEGYTVTAANVALFPENTYSYMQREQAEGRIRRPGQNKKMLFADIITAGTIDRRIAQAIRNKEELSERVLLQTARAW